MKVRILVKYDIDRYCIEVRSKTTIGCKIFQNCIEEANMNKFPYNGSDDIWKPIFETNINKIKDFTYLFPWMLL